MCILILLQEIFAEIFAEFSYQLKANSKKGISNSSTIIHRDLGELQLLTPATSKENLNTLLSTCHCIKSEPFLTSHCKTYLTF